MVLVEWKKYFDFHTLISFFFIHKTYETKQQFDIFKMLA